MTGEKNTMMTTEQKKLDDEVTLYTVSNGKMSFSAMNLGCTITKILVPARDGKLVDILLGFDTLQEYRDGKGAHSAVVGRVANRIKAAAFSLDGKTYRLDADDGRNCLHGGFDRYEKKVWAASVFEEGGSAGVRFRRTSADGEQGFPGTVQLEVAYTLDGQNRLSLVYTATTDKATPINLTNHAYFNLDGRGTILSHELCLDCDKILEVDGELIPTGRLLDVTGTPFDFRKPKAVGQDMKPLVPLAGGYDHCFVTKAHEDGVCKVGWARGAQSGIRMEISTNQCGMQVYGGNFVGGKPGSGVTVPGKGGTVQENYGGICFETQRFPDAVNNPSFPNSILRPGETYRAETVLGFSAE